MIKKKSYLAETMFDALSGDERAWVDASLRLADCLEDVDIRALPCVSPACGRFAAPHMERSRAALVLRSVRLDITPSTRSLLDGVLTGRFAHTGHAKSPPRRIGPPHVLGPGQGLSGDEGDPKSISDHKRNARHVRPRGCLSALQARPVSYTHLTLPTILLV